MAEKKRSTADRPAAEHFPSVEATRRLTLDIPANLHFAMKMRATASGVPMVDEVTPLLLEHYAADLKRYRR